MVCAIPPVLFQKHPELFSLAISNMNSSKHDKCRSEGCALSASFGYPNSRRRVYCRAHKETGMANVSNPLCRSAECTRQATFGLRSGPRRVFCSLHREDEMVHTSKKEPPALGVA